MSVRSAEEVDAALEGGADIIDAKEPDRGSLGPVPPEALGQILDRMPKHQPFSAAMGDVATAEQVAAAFEALELPPRAAATYLKFGFAGVRSPSLIANLLGTAVRLAARRPSPPLVIAVAYADAGRAGVPLPDVISRQAREAGAAGVLVDTCVKDGSCLLDWLSPESVARWVCQGRGLGLLTAVAGALGPDDLASACLAQPDIVGVRGAACDAGRSGRVSGHRVALLRSRLDQVPGGFGSILRKGEALGETRDGGAQMRG